MRPGLNHRWNTIQKLAKDRQRWKTFVAALHASGQNVQRVINSLEFIKHLSSWHFSQTRKTTEANFTCPPGQQTSIFTSPRVKFTCPEQSDLGFFPALLIHKQVGSNRERQLGLRNERRTRTFFKSRALSTARGQKNWECMNELPIEWTIALVKSH